MAAIEKLLTMGLAHGADPTRMLLAAGGTPQPEVNRLTWEDVTRAVVTLPLAQRAALYLKCAPELSSAQELASFTNELLLALSAHDTRRRTYSAADREAGWVFGRQAQVVRVAVMEYMDPRTCRRCQGEGDVLNYVRTQGMVAGTCDLCQGKGWRPWSENQRSRRVGVRRADWTHRYAAGYQRVLDATTTTYVAAAAGFKNVLFGHESGPEHDGLEARLQAGC